MSYQKDPRPFFQTPLPQRYPGAQHFLFVKIILIATIFGFFAGSVGVLTLETYFLPQRQTYSFLPIFSRTNEIPSQGQSFQGISFLAAERKEVNWYYGSQKKILPGRDNLWYISGNPQGEGIILTSDGWIIVAGDVGKNVAPKDILISLFDGKIFEAEKILFDSFLQISFIKIPADNLSVVQFGKLKEENEILYRILSNHSFEEYRVTGMVRKENTEIILSADKLHYFLSASGEVQSSEIGSSLLNKDGEIVGILHDRKDGKIFILPSIFLEGAISTILQNEKISKVSFGFSYLPLEEIFFSSREFPRQGILLVDSPENSLVKSFFGKNLREGDILVSIDDITLSPKNPVEYVLRSLRKKTGDEIKIKVRVSGSQELEEIKVRFP